MRIPRIYVVIIVLLLACAKIPPHVGKSRDIVTISSKINEPLIVNALQVYNYVPQKEGLFTFLFAQDTAITHYDKFH